MTRIEQFLALGYKITAFEVAEEEWTLDFYGDRAEEGYEMVEVLVSNSMDQFDTNFNVYRNGSLIRDRLSEESLDEFIDSVLKEEGL